MKQRQRLSAAAAALMMIALSGCKVGPKYTKPSVPLAPEFKEAAGAAGWKQAEPRDAALQGKWWELYGDPQLNALEEQIEPANLTLRQAEANFRAARSAIQFNRAGLSSQLYIAPQGGAQRLSAHAPYRNQTNVDNGQGNFSLPLDLNYEIDLWGRIRRSVTAAQEQAQASAADLETARLSLHAELAINYFDLRAADGQKKLLDEAVQAFRDALQLTQDRYDGGVAPLSDVAQARTQLQQAEVQATEVGVLRSQYEHAIAVLTGKPPSAVTLATMPITVAGPALPQVPGVLPSELLERRPDIAARERRMAAANEQIGIAQAAFYPSLNLSAMAGFQGNSIPNWFTWPSRFWAVTPVMTQMLFDAGRRRANSRIVIAQYDATVAAYQQTALTAFQQVEDSLAALRILETEAGQQREVTRSAQETLDLFKIRYEGGVDTYLQVITSQTITLQNQRNEIDILRRRLDASVLLIKAVGGGWNTSQLPPV